MHSHSEWTDLQEICQKRVSPPSIQVKNPVEEVCSYSFLNPYFLIEKYFVSLSLWLLVGASHGNYKIFFLHSVLTFFIFAYFAVVAYFLYSRWWMLLCNKYDLAYQYSL